MGITETATEDLPSPFSPATPLSVEVGSAEGSAELAAPAMEPAPPSADSESQLSQDDDPVWTTLTVSSPYRISPCGSEFRRGAWVGCAIGFVIGALVGTCV